MDSEFVIGLPETNLSRVDEEFRAALTLTNATVV